MQRSQMIMATAARHLPHLLQAAHLRGYGTYITPPDGHACNSPASGPLSCGGTVCSVASRLRRAAPLWAPGPDTSTGPPRSSGTDTFQDSGAATAPAPAAQRRGLQQRFKFVYTPASDPSLGSAASLSCRPLWRQRSSTAAQQANGSPYVRLPFDGAPPVCRQQGPAPSAAEPNCTLQFLYSQCFYDLV